MTWIAVVAAALIVVAYVLGYARGWMAGASRTVRNHVELTDALLATKEFPRLR